LERYRLLKKLKTNPIFDTYLARPAERDEQGFEVIMQKPHTDINSELKENWSARLYLATQISTEHLVHIFHMPDEEDETSSAITEYVWGDLLGEKSVQSKDENDKLSVLRVIQIVAELAELVESIHKELNISGIDLSPENIALGYDGKTRLLGLGLQLPAQITWGNPWNQLTQDRLPYLSPEQLRGETVTPASDVYSLGVLLYVYTTHQEAFRGETPEETRSLICSGTLDNSPLQHKDYPSELREIINKAITNTPETRYSSAFALSVDLRAYLDKMGHSEHHTPEDLLQQETGLQDNNQHHDGQFTSDYSGPKMEQLLAFFESSLKGVSPEQIQVQERSKAPSLRRSAIIRAVHTLRDAIPDGFSKAAGSAQRVTVWIFSLTALFLVIATVWHQQNHQWPWENLFNPSNLSPPPVAGRALPVTTDLTVMTTPPGGHLIVNGMLAEDTSPSSVQIVPDTINQITAFLSGFTPFTYRFDPRLNEIHEAGLAFNLDPETPEESTLSPGKVLLTTEPEGVALWVDGIMAGVSPLELFVSSNRPHHITARATGYLDTVAYFNVREYQTPQDQKVFHLILRAESETPRIYTYLNIDCYPPGALVSVNGQPVGHSPVGFSREIDQTYQLEINQDGYEPWRETIYPKAGRFEIQPRLFRYATGPSQLTIRVSGEDTPGTRIYLGRPGSGANELGSDLVRSLEIDSGIYELTLSYRPTTEEGVARRRSKMPITIPAETDLMLEYTWTGHEFELQEREEEPLPVH
jgi:serine/threonine protein kinase